jgi:hypothetical protein
MPLNWVGTASSTLDDTDEAREACLVGVDSVGVDRGSPSESSSSSPPMANAPSSGTSLSDR